MLLGCKHIDSNYTWNSCDMIVELALANMAYVSPATVASLTN